MTRIKEIKAGKVEGHSGSLNRRQWHADSLVLACGPDLCEKRVFLYTLYPPEAATSPHSSPWVVRKRTTFPLTGHVEWLSYIAHDINSRNVGR